MDKDESYIGGEKPGKRGRDSRNKIPFEAAIEMRQDGRPLKIHLCRIRGFRSTEITRYAKARLVSGSTVYSDGLYCFKAVTDTEHEHIALFMDGGRKSVRLFIFK
ncbi:MAG: transposase [Candidatus Thiodiazotropha lotti]|nr:transposase [Candidatus Thiodiazotropha lotti]